MLYANLQSIHLAIFGIESNTPEKHFRPAGQFLCFASLARARSARKARQAREARFVFWWVVGGLVRNPQQKPRTG